jgi:tetratricopeptide (TPR) repeat protein
LREQVLVPQSQGKRPRLFPTLQAPELRVVASTNVQSAFESSSTNLEESIPPTIPNVDDVVSKVSATAADNRRVLAGMAVACAALIAASLWQNISSKMDVASPAASLSKNPAPEPTTANQPPVVLAPELPASRAPISDVVNDRVAVAAIEIAHDTSVNSTSTAPAESPAQQARGDQSEPAASTDVSSLLNAAEADLRARRLTLPAGNNAVEKYRAVLKLEPKNAEAHRGLQRVGAILLARAQKQLAAGDFDASVESLRRARTIDPGSARIGELEKSLAERKRVAQTPRIPQPYPPVFKSLPPAPLEVVAPPVVKEANRAEQLRQRLGGIQ